MKATVVRHLNDIVSLTVLTLMAAALIAGQVDAAAHVAESVSDSNFQVVLEVRSQ
jgi:hypothetical protein